jgi:hypothetical protein
MNFFHWIRDGVRQAVLLGVSDAVTDLGKPSEDDDISHRLLEVIRNPRQALTDERGDDGAGGVKRRKLGRGLQEVQAAKAT